MQAKAHKKAPIRKVDAIELIELRGELFDERHAVRADKLRKVAFGCRTVVDIGRTRHDEQGELAKLFCGKLNREGSPQGVRELAGDGAVLLR